MRHTVASSDFSGEFFVFTFTEAPNIMIKTDILTSVERKGDMH